MSMAAQSAAPEREVWQLLAGVPDPLASIAHNPGNQLSATRTATFVLDNGDWKLQSVD